MMDPKIRTTNFNGNLQPLNIKMSWSPVSDSRNSFYFLAVDMVA